MILRSESVRLGLQKQAFGVRSVAKPSFHRSWNSFDFSINFGMIFSALETGFKIDVF